LFLKAFNISQKDTSSDISSKPSGYIIKMMNLIIFI
jgi:hypothetical protein